MQVEEIFQNRYAAGRELASQLEEYANQANVIVLALPRGGVPVGYEVARVLHLPLDVLGVRKLGVPGHEELAFGAIASGGIRVLNDEVVSYIPDADTIIATAAAKQLEELERREFLYRGSRPSLEVHGKQVIVVDDGLATGATMRAAVLALRQKNAEKIIVAVPVASEEACQRLEEIADRVVSVEVPRNFMAVGQFYADFSQTSDEEVRTLLAKPAQELGRI